MRLAPQPLEGGKKRCLPQGKTATGAGPDVETKYSHRNKVLVHSLPDKAAVAAGQVELLHIHGKIKMWLIEMGVKGAAHLNLSFEAETASRQQ